MAGNNRTGGRISRRGDTGPPGKEWWIGSERTGVKRFAVQSAGAHDDEVAEVFLTATA